MPEQLRVTRTHHPVTALGYGTRLGIWLQGCPLACPGCIAKDTWDPDGGLAVDVDELLDDVRHAIEAGADGLTVSGGEPLEQATAVTTFLRGVRDLGTTAGVEFDILMYTGYELAELDATRRDASSLADVLITGRYVVSKPTNLIWRGSANQTMVLQTPLAEARYASYVEHEPVAPPIQLESTSDGRAWWVGVPNHPGTKKAVEATLAALGYTVESVSWRRPR